MRDGERENNRRGIGKEREDESFNEASTDYWTDDCRSLIRDTQNMHMI